MVVRMIDFRRIGRQRQIRIAIRARKTPEVVVKGVVLLDDDHDVLNRAFRSRTWCWRWGRRRGRRLAFGGRSTLRGGTRLAFRYSFPHPAASLLADRHN